MEDFLSYLDASLGLETNYAAWTPPASMPAFLRSSAKYYLCSCQDQRFVVALPSHDVGLPALKRIVNQTRRYTNFPIAIVSSKIDPRQRRALTSQGIAFVVPHKQAYLPFLALVAKAEADKRSYRGELTPRAQAALVALIANPDVSSSEGLRTITGMSASTTSRAVDELAQRGIIERGKCGRNVTITYDHAPNALLHKAMSQLRTPVARTIYAQRCLVLESLPDAGESALAARSMLAAPAITQKAATKAVAPSAALREVLEGELPDEETIELQIWHYNPLVAGLDEIDGVSLGASLVDLGDERIEAELDHLFGEDGLWR